MAEDFSAQSDAVTTAPDFSSQAEAAPDFSAQAAPVGARSIAPQIPELSAAPPRSVLTRFRESLSPLIGPTENQRLRESIPWGTDKDGNPVYAYKPLGGAGEQEGFLPALSKPAVPLPRFKHTADEGVLAGGAKAVGNVAENFAEFAESPLGVATLGAGELAAVPKGMMAITPEAKAAVAATQGLQRATAAGFAAQLASGVPAAARQAGTTSVTGSPGEKIEADLGLGTQVALPGVLGGGAAGRAGNPLAAESGAPETARPATEPVKTADGQPSEFGGLTPEAPSPAPAAAPDFSAEAVPVVKGDFQTAQPPAWMQTGADFYQARYAARRSESSNPNATVSYSQAAADHEAAVRSALAQGLPVPPEVRAEYPELQAGPAPAATGAPPAPAPFIPGDADETAHGGVEFLPEDRGPVAGGGGMPMGARPPDLIDVLQGDVGGKLSLASARETQPDFKPTGALRKLFTATGGHALDQAAQDVAHFRAFGSADEFLKALQDAADARKGWQAQTQTLDAWLKSKKVDLSGKLLEGVTSLPVHLWNASIDVVRLGVAGGKLLHEAVEDGIGWLKTNYPDVKFDDQQYREAVTKQFGVRQFAGTLAADPDVSPGVKAQVDRPLYEKRTNESDLGAAQRLVQTVGLEPSIRALEDPAQPLPGGVRSALSNFLIKHLSDQERSARAGGNAAAADALAGQQVRVINARFERGTDVAQELQGMAAYGQMTAEGMLKHAQSVFAQAGDKQMAELRPVIETLRRGMESANASAVADTIRDPKVNDAARAAVNEAVAAHPAVQQAAAAEARETGKPVDVAQRIQQGRAASPQAAGGAPGTARPANELDTRIRAALQAANVRLGDLVRQHASQVDATGKSIGDRIVADSGLTGPRADALREAFNKRFAELATAKKQAVLAQMLKQGQRVPGKLRGLVDRLITWTNLGAFDTQAFYHRIRARLGVPEITPQMQVEIVKRANALQSLPEGSFLRERAGVELLNYIGQQAPLKWWEKPMALWYANILSHAGTPAHIYLDNLSNLAAHSLITLIRRPGALPEVTRALGRGTGAGIEQAGEVLKTGIVTGLNSRIAMSRVLERNPFTGWSSFLNNWKYVGRVISAAHLSTFQQARELRWTMAAHDAARSEGLRGRALDQRVADLLGNTAQRVDAARAQAAAEGLKGLDLRRRTTEILEAQREAAMPGSAALSQAYARRVTYLNEPYGVIGAIVKGLDGAQKTLESEDPLAAMAGRTMLPFKHIVGNLINEKLNYFPPAGIYRAWRAARNGHLYGEPMVDPHALGDQITKPILGLLAMTAATALISRISGAGPRSPEQRRQLEQSGWLPNSIKVGGRYYNYMRTPLALPFTVMAAYHEAGQYGKLSDDDRGARAAYAMMAVPDSIIHESFLRNIGETLDALREEDPKQAGLKMEQTLTRNAAGFVSPGLLQDVDKLFDPTVYDARDIAGMLRQQVPLVRREGNPTLNVLGEPLQRPLFSGDTRAANPDPLWRDLVENHLTVPEPKRGSLLVDKENPDNSRAITDDEYYQLVSDSGPRIRDRLVATEGRWSNMPPERAQKFIEKIAAEEHEKVLARMAR